MFKIIALIAALLVGLGYFLATGSGKPIATDLSVVGQGKPALVLAYENYSPAGGEALNRLRNIRSDFDSQLNFVVAELGTPQGRAFADRHELLDGLAVFLNAEGQAVQVMGIPANEQELRSQIESNLATVN